MNEQAEHLKREEYVGVLSALRDARRVLRDLEDLAVGRTVVSADEFAFLARRARDLVTACITLEEGRA